MNVNYKTLDKGDLSSKKFDSGGSQEFSVAKAARTAWLVCLFVGAMLTGFSGWSQLNYSQPFATNAGSWALTGGYSPGWISSNGCIANGSIQSNFYSGGVAGTFTSPALTSTGMLASMSYNYKILNYASTVAGPAAFGSFRVQYATSASGPWTTVQTIGTGGVAHVASASCAAKATTFTPPAGTFYVRFDIARTSGDWQIYIDDIAITQQEAVACSGTPTPGNTLASSSAACSGGTSILSLQNQTIGSGVSYQWQSSDNIDGPWANLGTASTYTATVTADKYYRATVSCGTETTASTPVMVSVNPFYNCYPIVSATNPGDTEMSNVTIGSLNNSSNCSTLAPGPGSILNRYSNYRTSVAAPDLMIGLPTPVSMTSTGCSGFNYDSIFQIYIDFNQDGTFSTDERVYNSTTIAEGNTATPGTIIIPTTALIGITGMRVVNVEASVSSTNYATTSYSWGETEDYLVNILPPPTTAPDCVASVSPLNGTTAYSPAGVLSWTAATGASNYDVYFGTSAETMSLVLDNHTGLSYAPVLLPFTEYFWQIIPSNSNGSAVDCAIQSFTTGAIPYCVPFTEEGCEDGDVIARVILNTLDNNSGTGCPSGLAGYSDYTSNPELTTTLQAGTVYDLTIFAGEYSQGYAAWIDYNDNSIFEANERVGFSNGMVAGSGFPDVMGASATFPISLACDPPVGPHRMRIRGMYNTNGSAVTPCEANYYGETEDYLITIAAPPACPQPTALASSDLTATSATLSWNAGCSETAWEIAVQPAGSGAPTSGVATTSNSYNATGLTEGVAYEFYVRANCDGDGVSLWTGPYLFTAPPCATLTSPTAGQIDVPVEMNASNVLQITLEWEAISGATGYQVWWGNSSSSMTNLGTAIANIVDITSVNYSTTYYWYIVPIGVNGTATGCAANVSSFTTESSNIPGDICSTAISLDGLTSPVSGTTVGASNDFLPSCLSSGTAADIFYSITVPANYVLTMNQTVNSYDSTHSVYYGSCESAQLIVCTDDNDTDMMTWTNNTGSTQTVYWIQDGYSSNVGTFTLAWTLCEQTPWYADNDADGFGNPELMQMACDQPEGFVANGDDCDDANPNANPDATEILYNGFDDNCDGMIDEGNQITTQIKASQCGAVISDVHAPISAVAVANATAYRFTIVDVATNESQLVVRTANWFTLIQHVAFNYGATYAVSVEVQRNGIWLGYDGPVCNITAPALSGNYAPGAANCGTTITDLYAPINAVNIPGATSYRFVVTNTNNPSDVQEVTRPAKWFTFLNLEHFDYGTAYMVQVSVMVNGQWTALSEGCIINTPNLTGAYEPRIRQCGVTFSDYYAPMIAQSFPNVTAYMFRVTNMTTLSVQEISPSTNWISFNNIADLQSGTAYEVEVSIMVNGNWSAYGTPCTVFTAGSAGIASNGAVTSADFKVVASPNPYSDTFELTLTESTDAQVEVQVYDMIGKLLEVRSVQPGDIASQKLGSNFPSGVYNVIVTQGETVKTLKVVKR